MTILVLLLGLFIGVALGMILMSLMVLDDRADETEAESWPWEGDMARHTSTAEPPE